MTDGISEALKYTKTYIPKRVICIKVEENLLVRLDNTIEAFKKISGNIGYTRSDFIREAINTYIDIMRKKIQIFEMINQLGETENA